MANTNRTLPEFELPPVIETVLSVQFQPLVKFTVPHFGLYWAKIRDQYPHVRATPPLSHAMEVFGGQRKKPGIGIRVVEGDEARCWFIDSTQTHLIQVQRDRFILNWRKVAGTEIYPRYLTFKPKFVDEWKRFRAFVADQALGVPEVNQCEVTYVNHFEFGNEWKSPADLPRVLSCWKGISPGSLLAEPELVQFTSRYILPEQKGRLHVTLQPAFRARDAKEVLQLNLTARGKPDSTELDDILKFFDLGHEWIVKGFTELTTAEMHRLWRRTL